MSSRNTTTPRVQALLKGMQSFDASSYSAYGGRCEENVSPLHHNACLLPGEGDEEHLTDAEPKGKPPKAKPAKKKASRARDHGDY